MLTYKKLSKDLNESMKSKGLNNIPKNWNWYEFFPDDTLEIRQKKLNMSSVKNQLMCGCCWAISCSSAISDSFVISDIVNWCPNISYTYALAKYSQNKCVGGSSIKLLEDIKNGEGIVSETCVDDRWCLNNPLCANINKQLGDFVDLKEDINLIREYISEFVPKEGCYNNDREHYIYEIDEVYQIYITENYTIDFVHNIIKKHIITRGPLVGVFPVPKNFVNGNFSSKDNGIFIENNNKKVLGAHSIIIVGWGMYEENNRKIPYWICKNSWGKKWGYNGLFKIAMYPINKVTQFTRKISVIGDSKLKEIGGVVGFKVSKFPKLRLMKKIIEDKNNITLETLSQKIKNKYSNYIQDDFDIKNILIFLFIIIFIFLGKLQKSYNFIN
jgi:hypothetical protein